MVPIVIRVAGQPCFRTVRGAGTIAVNHGANGGRRDQWDVNGHEQERAHSRPIDGLQSREHRRELTGPVGGVDDHARRQTGGRDVSGNPLRVVAEHDDDVVGAPFEERPHDARQKGFPIGHGHERLRSPHARRQARCEDNSRDHATILATVVLGLAAHGLEFPA